MRCEHRWGSCLLFHGGHRCDRYANHRRAQLHRCNCGAMCSEPGEADIT